MQYAEERAVSIFINELIHIPLAFNAIKAFTTKKLMHLSAHYAVFMLLEH